MDDARATRLAEARSTLKRIRSRQETLEGYFYFVKGHPSGLVVTLAIRDPRRERARTLGRALRLAMNATHYAKGRVTCESSKKTLIFEKAKGTVSLSNLNKAFRKELAPEGLAFLRRSLLKDASTPDEPTKSVNIESMFDHSSTMERDTTLTFEEEAELDALLSHHGSVIADLTAMASDEEEGASEGSLKGELEDELQRLRTEHLAKESVESGWQREHAERLAAVSTEFARITDELGRTTRELDRLEAETRDLPIDVSLVALRELQNSSKYEKLVQHAQELQQRADELERRHTLLSLPVERRRKELIASEMEAIQVELLRLQGATSTEEEHSAIRTHRLFDSVPTCGES